MVNIFVIGDRVVLEDQSGEITNGFHVGYPPPPRTHIPVQWDNGDRSYEDPEDLCYEYLPIEEEEEK